MGFDNAETHCQSNPGADAGGFGGEIRLEYPRAKRFRNAGTVVCHLDADHVIDKIETAGHIYPPRCGLFLQGLLRVDDQVEQYLMELVSVSEDERNVLGEIQR